MSHSWETPPRAWGRPNEPLIEGSFSGNTPTGVGKTRPRATAHNPTGKHPHGRGEDDIHSEKLDGGEETPPRAWGRLDGTAIDSLHRGNTPTGVGKTTAKAYTPRSVEKHPHGRGEDPSFRNSARCPRETPPRAWGRHKSASFSAVVRRNTPTGVGKTIAASCYRNSARKHPHGRGEDLHQVARLDFALETPPRAWGRPPLM